MLWNIARWQDLLWWDVFGWRSISRLRNIAWLGYITRLRDRWNVTWRNNDVLVGIALRGDIALRNDLAL